MRKNIVYSYPILFFLFISFSMFSCSSTKNIKYFQDIPDSGALKKIANVEYVEPKIQVDDILTITIQTLDAAATESINRGNIPSLSTGATLNSNISQQVISGYLVSKQGDIEVPFIGKIHVLGMSTWEAASYIRGKSEAFFKDPSVSVRYANFKVIVTGEVARPSTYVLPNEKVTILDALALAGDLTIYGKRENVLLIRENPDGTKSAYRINLNKSNTFLTDTYYLHQNDYIYVEPTKGKVAANDLAQTRTITIIGSILSLLIVAASRFVNCL